MKRLLKWLIKPIIKDTYQEGFEEGFDNGMVQGINIGYIKGTSDSREIAEEKINLRLDDLVQQYKDKTTPELVMLLTRLVSELKFKKEVVLQ